MFQSLHQFLFVPSIPSERDPKLIKFNVLSLTVIFMVMIFHSSIAFFYTAYFRSLPYKLAITWGISLLCIYAHSKKNGFRSFKSNSIVTIILCLALGFDDHTFYLGVFSAIITNQWLTALSQKKMSMIQSILQILLFTFRHIPRLISQIDEIDDLEELKTSMISHFTRLKYIYIVLTIISLVIMNVNTLRIEDEEKLIRREELEKRIRTQEHLILSFSHELNNPIHTIINNLYELKGRIAQDTNTQSIIKATKSSVSFLSCFVNNVLDVSKVDQNNLELNPIHVKLKHFLTDLWENCATIIESKQLKSKIKFIGTFQNDTIYTLEPHRIRQIVYNIVNNAVKYTSEGSIKLYVSIHTLLDPELTQSVANGFGSRQSTQFDQPDSYFDLSEGSMSTRYLRLEIKDTGCGIEENKINSVFMKQEFESNNCYSQQKQQQSLKLGVSLWLTQSIIKQLGGKISIHSEIGKGTSVIVILPVIQASLFYEKQKKLLVGSGMISSFSECTAQAEKQKIKALIVEDVPFNQAIVKNYLTKAKVEVLGIAENGEIAVKKFKEYFEKGIKIDIICMDIEMPLLNGKEATRRIRAIEKEKQSEQTKIFFVSGNTIKREIDECLDKDGEIRGDAFLKKPLQYDEFQTTIQSIMIDNQ